MYVLVGVLVIVKFVVCGKWLLGLIIKVLNVLWVLNCFLLSIWLFLVVLVEGFVVFFGVVVLLLL